MSQKINGFACSFACRNSPDKENNMLVTEIDEEVGEWSHYCEHCQRNIAKNDYEKELDIKLAAVEVTIKKLHRMNLVV